METNISASLKRIKKRFEERQAYYYGKHAGYCGAMQDVEDEIKNTKCEEDITLGVLIEPSDEEQANWPPATKEYVSLLEDFIFIQDAFPQKKGAGIVKKERA